ncbi:MAG: SusC/RagA family TonB-linked outer membrane protein, partial [Syntrophomonadaceae bacterium]|nr:SusC/RagA family TonB-linked outer membrane protein [Syntrophomonadaceae bacterium]
SIEVLKDASSSAIYGSKAANGVILITTKKGQIGKPTINININSGVESMINAVDVLNREDFLQFMDDARAQAYVVEDPNRGTDNPNAPLWDWSDSDETRIYNWRNFSSMRDAMSSPGSLYERWEVVTPETKAQPYDTDWQKIATQKGQVHDLQLSTSGGSEAVTYMISGGYFDQEGILSDAGYERFSFRSNIELKITDWMRTGLLLAPSLENLGLMSVESHFYDLIRIAPIRPAYDENGDPAFLGGRSAVLPPGEDWTQWNLADHVNPLERVQAKDKRRTLKNLGTIFGEVDIIEGLTFRSELHSEFRYWDRNYFLPSTYPTTNIISTTRSRGINQQSSRFFWNMQNMLKYTKNFGNHSVNALLGYTAQEASYRSSYIDKYDYPSDYIPTLNQALTIRNTQNDARTNRSSESEIGTLARILYNYAEKYYITASIRRDASSKFGADKKWGTFPSVSAAWRISDESFFEPLLGYINDLKIRGGWGVIGNSGIGNYNALPTLSSVTYVLGKGSTSSAGYQDGRVANSGLGWETTTDIGFGTDIELFDSRISLTVDYFNKLTEDMLFSMPLPRVTGFSSYMVNIGSMRNRGWEYMVKTRNFTGNFKWSTNFNLSYYRNRVLDTGKDKRPLISTSSYTTEDKPLALLYGYAQIGIFKDWEDIKTNPIWNASNPNWMWRSCPGTAKLADVNGDGILDGSDQTIIGNPNHDFIWGMTNNMSFKGFDLSVQITGVQGGKMLNTQLTGVNSRANGTTNVTYDYYNNYWRPDRTDAKYSAPTRKSWDGTPTAGSLLWDRTYINIQNISFGYTVPRSITQRWDVNRLRVYTSIQNAAFITKYPGYNPEVNSAGSSALSQAVDAGAYPLTRMITFGINVSL